MQVLADLDPDEIFKRSPTVDVEGKIILDKFYASSCANLTCVLTCIATPDQSCTQHVPTTQPVSTPPNEEEPQVMVDLSKVPDGTLGKSTSTL